MGKLAYAGLALVLGCSSSSAGRLPDSTDAGEAGAPGDGGACIGTGANCRGMPNACCNGSTCVFDTADPSKAVCAATCLRNDQCRSGCCTVLIEGTEAVCAPVKFCAGSCSKPSEQCKTQSCCANAICVDSTVTGVSCSARCANNDQCAAGCCAPLDNTGELVCSPPTFCR